MVVVALSLDDVLPGSAVQQPSKLLLMKERELQKHMVRDFGVDGESWIWIAATSRATMP
jgi:hypothetical protein